MKNTRFNIDEWPYEKLEMFGLTREMIEDLPTDVLESLSVGDRSPVLPLKVENDQGEVVTLRSRIEFQLGEDAKVCVVFYPVMLNPNLDRFNESERKRLLDGMVIKSDIKLPDGKMTKGFVQLDKETNRLLAAPFDVVKNNVEAVLETLSITKVYTKAVLDGKVVSKHYNEVQACVGVDLNNPDGVRYTLGNEEDWWKEGKREHNKYTFGIYGCWVENEDGNIDYVHDDDYTEEMWDEQRKAGQRNMASMHR